MAAHDTPLVLQGGSPWHFKWRADDTENADYWADDEEHDNGGEGADDRGDYSFADAVADDEEGVNPVAIAVVAAALVIGIGLGAGATVLWMSSHHARRPPAVAAAHTPAASRPAPLAVASSPPPVEAGETVAPVPAAGSASPRVHKASARPKAVHTVAHTGAAHTGTAAACRAGGSRRQALICAWPQIAADDREMRRAYQHAVDAGVERSTLQASQDRWSTVSELAAGRSAAALAAAYHRQIADLNALAASEPPH